MEQEKVKIVKEWKTPTRIKEVDESSSRTSVIQ